MADWSVSYFLLLRSPGAWAASMPPVLGSHALVVNGLFLQRRSACCRVMSGAWQINRSRQNTPFCKGEGKKGSTSVES